MLREKTAFVALRLVTTIIVGLFFGEPALGYQEIPGLAGLMLSGYSTLDIDTNKGDRNTISVNPVLTVPLGKGLLTGEWEQEIDLFNLSLTDVARVEYLKFQYPLNDHLMIDIGRTLLPFGDWLERYHPSWIQKLRQPPMVSGLLPGHSANGFQLRGGYLYSLLGRETALNYTLYHMVSVKTNNYLASKEGSGGKFSLFFPERQLEWGLSGYAGHGRHSSLVGTNMNWRPDRYTSMRGEFTHANNARGFWFLASRELARYWPDTPILKASEVVFRVEQLWVDSASGGDPEGEDHEDEEVDHHDMAMMEEEDHEDDGDHDEDGEEGMGHEGGGGHGGHGGALPNVDTTRLTFGWNFYPTESHNLKLMLSYGQSFAREDDGGRFGVAVSYRW